VIGERNGRREGLSPTHQSQIDTRRFRWKRKSVSFDSWNVWICRKGKIIDYRQKSSVER
jgi:hypothetical protein